ncbi:uncharacterized protein LOC125178722 [Hyalella azteca]|uniref:Uncharacterized protein LOC125178722 n=1 Tax=Hyalella azteca TaxID=294128 RepID=A0A979FPV3_HYAAZ|nr:uncharacterized protein LOC125178722 [Hyalella azteca]
MMKNPTHVIDREDGGEDVIASKYGGDDYVHNQNASHNVINSQNFCHDVTECQNCGHDLIENQHGVFDVIDGGHDIASSADSLTALYLASYQSEMAPKNLEYLETFALSKPYDAAFETFDVRSAVAALLVAQTLPLVVGKRFSACVF